MNLQQLLNSPAVNVFLGTMPLLLAFVWGVISNNAALTQILQRLTRLEGKVDNLTERVVKMEVKVDNLAERVGKIETRLEGRHVLLT